jgi:hypothetical protein
MNNKEELSLSGSANTQSPPTDIHSHSHRVVRRRSFLKGLGIAGATLLPATALLMTKSKAQADERQERKGKLTKGDVRDSKAPGCGRNYRDRSVAAI